MNPKAIMIISTAGLMLLPMTLAAVGCVPAPRARGGAMSDTDRGMARIQEQRRRALEHYRTATELHNKDKPDEALEEYRKALELDDQLYAAWNNMGQLLMARGNYSDAVSAYQIAAGIEPTDPRPEYNIGLAYQQVGWAQDAHTHFKMALDRDPNYMPALRGLIRSAELMGMGDEKLLVRIRNAQLRENDEQWREYFQSQYFRVNSMVEEND